MKFRAWHKTQKKFNNDAVNPLYLSAGGKLFSLYYGEPIEETDIYDVQFYTGIKDSSGVEICQGDVIEYRGKVVGQVEWNDTAGAWDMHLSGNVLDQEIGYESEYMKIVGNVHDGIKYK